MTGDRIYTLKFEQSSDFFFSVSHRIDRLMHPLPLRQLEVCISTPNTASSTSMKLHASGDEISQYNIINNN